MIAGVGIKAIRVSRGCIDSIKVMDSAKSSTIRNTDVSCSDKKFLVVSMSEVHRWMISPVLFFICQAKGRCSMWENKLSRIVFTRVSDAFVLNTRKAYWAPTCTTATPTTARAMIQRFLPRKAKPPMLFTASVTNWGKFPSLPPMAQSTAARMIWGCSISARAVMAAHRMLAAKNRFAPFKKRQRSGSVLLECSFFKISSSLSWNNACKNAKKVQAEACTYRTPRT